MSLLTVDLVNEAIDLALPSVRAIAKRHTWSPEGVTIVVGGVGLDEPVEHVMEELGPEDTWSDRWGEHSDFRLYARKKMEVSLRTGRPSGEVVADAPWLLEEGDTFWQGGVAEDTSLAVGASGIYGEADEAIAWIVWNIIRMLCLLAIRRRRDAGDKVLGDFGQ